MTAEPLSQQQFPKHVAIIMDGNGRWAEQRGLERTQGHRHGVETLRTTLKAASKLGIRYLTVYGFSSENWQRPEDEVSELMNLLRYYLRHEIQNLRKDNVRLRVIGDRSKFSADILELITFAEDFTRDGRKIDLILALSYGARDEIVKATQKVAQDVSEGKITVDQISEPYFASNLFTHDLPDPDLLIRTSGEVRISNFLLWQLAYAELYFSEKYWPDFDEEELKNAIAEFSKRERRYGKA